MHKDKGEGGRSERQIGVRTSLVNGGELVVCVSVVIASLELMSQMAYRDPQVRKDNEAGMNWGKKT